jgi:hypothetical protein
MTSVDAADCERAAIRAYLRGVDDECAKHWETAVQAARNAGDLAESARYAFWLGFGFMMRGQAAPASGWLSRAEALVADAGTECRASGYVLIPRCLVAIDEGTREGPRWQSVLSRSAISSAARTCARSAHSRMAGD